MLKRWSILMLMGLFVGGVQMSASGAEPKVGDEAPQFELKGSDDKVHKLADYVGKQAIVIAWYPKAKTGG